MRKIKTLIVIDNLGTGGIASSLINYLNYIKELTDCELLVFSGDVVQECNIPLGIKIRRSPFLLKILGKSQQDIKKDSIFLYLLRLILVIISRITNGEISRSILFLFLKKLKGYDLAISYAHDNAWKSISKGCNDYVVKKVEAKHKAAFIHCDYKNYGGYDKRQGDIFEKFNTIICVSESCKQNFIEMFPFLKNKCIACENFINTCDIEELASDAHEYPQDVFVFISVCRLSEGKGLHRTLNAFSKLNNEGFKNFQWYIVGDGPLYADLKRDTEKLGLEENVFLLGKKKNPFPYIKHANALLLPSYQEAAPMVFGEAATLQIQIITTNTCSAKELVEDRGIGVVCENSEDGIYNVLYDILDKQISLDSLKKIPSNSINEIAIKQCKTFFSKVERTIIQ